MCEMAYIHKVTLMFSSISRLLHFGVSLQPPKQHHVQVIMNDDIGLLRSLTTEVWIVKKKKKISKVYYPFHPLFTSWMAVFTTKQQHHTSVATAVVVYTLWMLTSYGRISSRSPDAAHTPTKLYEDGKLKTSRRKGGGGKYLYITCNLLQPIEKY